MAIQYTANFHLPFPNTDRSDTADVPRDISALAQATDASLLSLRRDDLIGEIKIWPTLVAPTGFLICDGSVLAQAGQYAALYGVVGGAFNTGGEGAGNFRLPDCRGRTLFGIDGAGGRLSANDALGNSGGFEAVTLNSGQIPAHAHPVNDPGHGHNVNDPSHDHDLQTAGQTSQGSQPGAGSIYGGVMAQNSGTGVGKTQKGLTGLTIVANGTGLTVQPNVGGGGSHPNLPPYLIIGNYVIRYA